MIDPMCINIGTKDCIFKSNGKCRVLSSTNFKGKPCPFYKSSSIWESTKKGAVKKQEKKI